MSESFGVDSSVQEVCKHTITGSIATEEQMQKVYQVRYRNKPDHFLFKPEWRWLTHHIKKVA
jgi:hypothetical protein